MQVSSTLQAVFFSCLLLTASLCDLRNRRIPDKLNLLIALTGFLVFQPRNLLGATLAVPFFVAAYVDEQSMGGGDIKFLAASCSVLGFSASLWGLIFSIPIPMALWMITVIKNLIQRKKKPWESRMSIPLIPLLTIGILPAYFLKLGGLIQ